jgi:ABC-type multidrug transport system ATPase subunit
MTIIDIQDLNIAFDKQFLYQNFSFKLEKGKKVVIAGGSGTGKTTMLNILLGFEKNYSGNIKIFNRSLNENNINYIRSQIAWLPQEFSLPLATAKELLLKPFEFKHNNNLTPSAEDIDKTLRQTGLDRAILNKPVKNISGGQKQRLAIASCTMLNRPLLFLDEPTSNLDPISIKKIMDYLFEQHDLTILSTSHNPIWIERCDQVIKTGLDMHI